MGKSVAESFVVNVTFFVWLGQVEEVLDFFVVEAVGLRFEDFSHDFRETIPLFSLSKSLKALTITSSGSVPWSLSANMFKKMVKLIGAPASAHMLSSMSWSRSRTPREA